MQQYTINYSHSNTHGLHAHIVADNEQQAREKFETEYAGCRLIDIFPQDKKEAPAKEETPHKEGKQHGS